MISFIQVFRALVTFTLSHTSVIAQNPPVSPTLPEIPPHTFSIPDFGAVGDGVTSNTAAFHAAVDACEKKGGGRILVPSGKFVSGPFELKSFMELHLEKGAVIAMSQRVEDYALRGNERQSFITAVDAHDIAITGEGSIDGQGQPWWDVVRELKNTPRAKTEPRRPQMIVFSRCERVHLKGFQTLNPPNTHFSLRQCQQVTIEGLKISAPDDSPNTDGLNLNVRNAVIRNCQIATGDDNIVLLASAPAKDGGPGVENISISGCRLGVGHGLSIGSFTGGGIYGVTVEDISFDGTTSGLRLKAGRDRGGLVKNVTYRNITMKNVRYPIYFGSYYPKEPKGPDLDPAQPPTAKTPRWENITVENGQFTDCVNSVIVWGLPEQPFTGVLLKNLTIGAQRGATIYHAKDVQFRAVELRVGKGAPLTTYDAEVEGMNASSYNSSVK